MKHLKTYENLGNTPDLRRLTNWVRCTKDPRNNRFKKYYIKDNIYKVEGIQGDPERAIEEFKINDYLPIECISTITINGYKFRTKYSYKEARDVIGDFWSYFELLSEEEESMQNNMVKYNL